MGRICCESQIVLAGFGCRLRETVEEIKVNKSKLLRFLPDSIYLRILFRHNMKKKLNLRNPTTYTEKLQWLKLHDRDPKYIQLVDKLESKEYVANIVGEEHVPKLYGVWDDPNDIDESLLPEQFVLKCTHDCGGLAICKDKTTFDLATAKDKLSEALGSNYYYYGREWPYKGVKPRVIAEEYLEDESGYELKDYKFFCFDGEVRALFVASGRQQGDVRFDFFDRDFNHLDIINGHPMADRQIKKPTNYDQMIAIAEALSKGLCHVRVDLYNVNGRIYFGELTFYHFSGVVPFEPDEWDEVFGSWLTLPE